MVEGIYQVMIDYKLEAKKQWNKNPCGIGDYLGGIEYESLEFFEAIRTNRYEVTDQWMKKAIDFNLVKGKKLLEIGHGLGTDLLSFSEAGARVYGIDISEEHHRLAKRNFELHGRECVLKLCDCDEIDFPSSTFDIVYSHGVLHHTPNTIKCISEAYRVLKYEGQFILGLYHKYSAYHIFMMLLYQGVIRGKLMQLGYQGLMSTVEYGADGINIKPLVKTYSKNQLRCMLADFRKVEFKITHFRREHFPYLYRLIPQSLEKYFEPIFGWYIIAYATK